MNEGYKTYEWFLKQDLSEHAGRWLAIVDRHVVATGQDAAQVIAKAKELCPGKRPLITKIRNRLSILKVWMQCH